MVTRTVSTSCIVAITWKSTILHCRSTLQPHSGLGCPRTSHYQHVIFKHSETFPLLNVSVKCFPVYSIWIFITEILPRRSTHNDQITFCICSISFTSSMINCESTLQPNQGPAALLLRLTDMLTITTWNTFGYKSKSRWILINICSLGCIRWQIFSLTLIAGISVPKSADFWNRNSTVS